MCPDEKTIWRLDMCIFYNIFFPYVVPFESNTLRKPSPSVALDNVLCLYDSMRFVTYWLTIEDMMMHFIQLNVCV